MEGAIEVTRTQERRRKQLMDKLKERRRYWKLEEKALAVTLENWLWKRVWTCRKTDCVMNE